MTASSTRWRMSMVRMGRGVRAGAALVVALSLLVNPPRLPRPIGSRLSEPRRPPSAPGSRPAGGLPRPPGR